MAPVGPVGPVAPAPGCSWPIVIVTTSPCWPVELPLGFWLITTPSWLGSVTGWVIVATVNPAPCRMLLASAAVRFVTSGTWEVAGPFETVRTIRVPFGAAVPCGGSIEITTPCGCWSEAASMRPTVKPSPIRADWAFAYGSPVTSGMTIGLAPRETLIVTVEPLSTLSPAAGSCPVTVSCCSLE